MLIIIIVVSISILIFLLSKIRIGQKEITHSYKLSSELDKFKLDFFRIIDKNPNLHYLVIDFKTYYVQYICQDSTTLFCESISNNHIEDGSQKLTHNQIDKIIELGFKEPFIDSDNNESPNYSKYYKIITNDDINLILNELISLIEKVYNIDYKESLDLNIRYSLK